MIASDEAVGREARAGARQRRDQDRRHGRLGDQQLAPAERDGGAHGQHDITPACHGPVPIAATIRSATAIPSTTPRQLDRALPALADRRPERDHAAIGANSGCRGRAGRPRGTTRRRPRRPSGGSATSGRAAGGGRVALEAPQAK
jgi:hypothetical protein